MRTNRLVCRFTLCLLSLCLSGWSLATTATAATIVVTTNQDVIDSPFTTANFCGSGTVANLPGADGKVSLREAIIATNNTPGQQTIKFAPSLNGNTIALTASLGSLFLCGGHTTLNGDINGDDTPDVTVDGTAAVTFFDVINVVSSHNTVKNLHVLVPPPTFFIPAGISVSNLLTPSVTDNVIVHNLVSGGPIAVVTGLDPNKHVQHAVSVKHTLVRDNTTTGILTIILGDHNAITDLAMTHNTVSGVSLSPPFNIPAIFVVGGRQNPFDPTDPGASDNQLDVTITDNTVTGNSNPHDTAGIGILGGLSSSSRNHVTAQVRNNTITDNDGRAIFAGAGVVGGSDNHLDVTTSNNIIKCNSTPGDTVGIAIDGGVLSSGNHIEAAVLNNTITDNIGIGIGVGAGINNSSHNDVEVAIRDNTLENNGPGILTFGGIGAAFGLPSGDSSGNSLDARIVHNTVKNALGFGIFGYGGVGSFDGTAGKTANNNELDIVMSNNTITGTIGEGIHLEAGSTGLASNNEVEIRVRKNTVCGSAAADIDALGGAPSNQGTGNKVEGEIRKNTATTVVVDNGVAGNVAQVAQSKNVACQ